jgi:SRSO17 transposase
MMRINRAIDRGCGFQVCASTGFEVLLAGSGNLCPETDSTFYGMKPFEYQYDHKQKFSTMDTGPIIGELRNFLPVTVELVSGTDLESLWDRLVSSYHYLGYQKLLGHRLKYLAFITDRPVAALSWSAPALKLAVRDCFIGWSAVQRKRHLSQIACNSRFLVMPWVKVAHLASHVIAQNIARLKTDWRQKFNHRLLVLETFVDRRYFSGTCYRASNWLHVGTSYGSSKQGKGYRYHGKRKEVFVYVLEPEFRSIIGCKQKPKPLFDRPPQSQAKVEELAMILEHCQWHPQLVAELNLSQDDIKLMGRELVDFHRHFHSCFGRIEHQRLGLAYISGLLSNAKAKSAEPIALEFLGKQSVRSVQMFMKNYRWDHMAMQGTHQRLLAPMISSPEGMITVDPSEFLKQGKESVGVARQYCGTVGKVENCQSGVFVGYSSKKGYGLLSGRLYVHESWFTEDQKQRRIANLVPEDLVFETKQQIALKLIDEVVATGLFSAKWIGADAAFRDIEFLNALPKALSYFVGIKSDDLVFTKKPKLGIPAYKGRGPRPKKVKVLSGQPKARKVSDIVKYGSVSWKPVIVAEGAKGPIVAKVARIRVYLSRDGLPIGDRQWLFLRKNADGQIKYAISNAPKKTTLAELTDASIMRWPIEQCFKEGKDQVGMDYYEHRSWPAWHRHMIYVFLALHFLLRLRLRYKKNSTVDAAIGSQSTYDSASAQIAQCGGGNGDC